MNLSPLFRQAFASLTRNWLRSVLTILGISVGVGAFICVVAIGNAGSSKIEDQLQSLGDNFVWIEAGSRSRNGMRAGARGTRSLVLNDAQAIFEQVPLIKSLSPNVDGHIPRLAACLLPSLGLSLDTTLREGLRNWILFKAFDMNSSAR